MVRVLSVALATRIRKIAGEASHLQNYDRDESPGKIEGERRSEIVNKRKRRNVKLVIKGARFLAPASGELIESGTRSRFERVCSISTRFLDRESRHSNAFALPKIRRNGVTATALERLQRTKTRRGDTNN